MREREKIAVAAATSCKIGRAFALRAPMRCFFARGVWPSEARAVSIAAAIAGLSDEAAARARRGRTRQR